MHRCWQTLRGDNTGAVRKTNATDKSPAVCGGNRGGMQTLGVCQRLCTAKQLMEKQMKPLHAALIRLSRCPCCQSKHSKRTRLNTGKSSARQRAKRDIKRELRAS